MVSVDSVHAVHAEDTDQAEEGALTAILVRPTGFAEASALSQDYYAGT
jgi:hypothetical protein